MGGQDIDSTVGPGYFLPPVGVFFFLLLIFFSGYSFALLLLLCPLIYIHVLSFLLFVCLFFTLVFVNFYFYFILFVLLCLYFSLSVYWGSWCMYVVS